MYLGVVHVSLSRKEHECVSCKEPIKVGEWKFLVVRKFKRKDGKDGRNSRYVHLECFPRYALYAQKAREEYLAKSGRVGTGRPQGSELQELSLERPDLARERKHLLQKRSRLHKKLLATAEGVENRNLILGGKEMLKERSRPILEELSVVERQIRAILPVMINYPGRRSEETRSRLEDLGAGEPRRASHREALRHGAVAAEELTQQPDPSQKTPEELEQIKKEIFERSEAYQESGQLWTEDGRD